MPPSRTRVVALILTLGLIALGACRDPDRPTAPDDPVRVSVSSDPQGAEIFVDGDETGILTPGTVHIPTGEHQVTAWLDSAGLGYSYTANLRLTPADSMLSVDGPLLVRCSGGCAAAVAKQHTANDVVFASNPTGPLFYVRGQGDGLLWPGATGNSYASVGTPLFSARVAGADVAVALGPYDVDYLAGRPAPVVERQGGLRLRQTFWILPPRSVQQFHTVRGIEVEEELVAVDQVAGVLVLRLTFRNITDRPSYRAADTGVPKEGVTYESAHIGFAVDADVGGGGGADDDIVSYAPELGLAFTYDNDFRESAYDADWSARPGLIGLRILEWPEGSAFLLNAWPGSTAAGTVDWAAGTTLEKTGFEWMRGTAGSFQDHVHPRVGYAPTSGADLRMLVSAGPLTLAPGDQASIRVAVLVAAPAAGTFTSGSYFPPGTDLSDPNRPILQTAAPLIERARAAEAIP